MMERLREAIEHCYEVAKDQCGNRCANEHIQLAKWLEDLQDFYALKEQGKLLELPCKQGDTVYIVKKVYYAKEIGINEVVPARVIRICSSRNEKGEVIWCIKVFERYGECLIPFDKFGKTVFPNYQEAKEALEGMKK